MEKTLRSLIQEKFDLELRIEIEFLSRRRDLINEEKQEELIKLLQSRNIENIVPLGAGTNRYAFKLDGFVIKVATDHDGKIDNLKEFKMAKRLYPHVSKTYEVSENGTFLVAEYIPPFGSYTEMCRYADKIREILTELSAVYLIGDVGITSKNFGNWGLRTGTDDPVCLDFAYVYEVSSELFICRSCNTDSMLVPNKDFTELHCSNPGCGRKYLFEDIRAKIGNDIHRHEIGDLSEEGYRMTQSNVLTTLDEQRSNYLAKKAEKAKKQKPVKKEEEAPYVDTFVMEYNPQEARTKEDNSMSRIDKAMGNVSNITNQKPMVVQATAVPISSERLKELSTQPGKIQLASLYGEVGIAPEEIQAEAPLTERLNNISNQRRAAKEKIFDPNLDPAEKAQMQEEINQYQNELHELGIAFRDGIMNDPMASNKEYDKTAPLVEGQVVFGARIDDELKPDGTDSDVNTQEVVADEQCKIHLSYTTIGGRVIHADNAVFDGEKDRDLMAHVNGIPVVLYIKLDKGAMIQKIDIISSSTGNNEVGANIISQPGQCEKGEYDCKVEFTMPEDDVTIFMNFSADNKSADVTEESTTEPSEITTPVEQGAENYISDPGFIANIIDAISKVSNKIKDDMYAEELYDEVRPGVRDKQMYTDTFLKHIQNAMFRSFIEFCKFSEKKEKRADGKGQQTVFIVPENLNDLAYEPTLIFISRIWKDRELSKHWRKPGKEFMAEYRKIYADYPGIQPEYLDVLRRRINKKMNIDAYGVDIIIDYIRDNWCVDDEPADDLPDAPEGAAAEANAPEAEETAIPEESEDIEVFETDKGDPNFMTVETRAELDAIAETLEPVAKEPKEVEVDAADTTPEEEGGDTSTVTFSAPINQESSEPQEFGTLPLPDLSSDYDGNDEDEDGDDDDDDEEPEYLSIEIYPEDDLDIVKICSGEAFGPIAIPLYCKLDSLSLEDADNLPSMVDNRNGIWDWLTCMVPDLMFHTKRPDYFLKVNNDEPGEGEIHIVILDENDGVYTMGIYYLMGIYVIDDDGEQHPCFSEDTLKRLNYLIKRDISYTSISHLKRSLAMDDMVYPEEYVMNYVLETTLDDDDDDEDDEPADINIDDMSEQERAAYEALTAYNEADVHPVTPKNEPNAHSKIPGTFRPIRRSGKE